MQLYETMGEWFQLAVNRDVNSDVWSTVSSILQPDLWGWKISLSGCRTRFVHGGLIWIRFSLFVLLKEYNIVLPCRGAKDRDSTCGTTLSTGQLWCCLFRRSSTRLFYIGAGLFLQVHPEESLCSKGLIQLHSRHPYDPQSLLVGCFELPAPMTFT